MSYYVLRRVEEDNTIMELISVDSMEEAQRYVAWNYVFSIAGPIVVEKVDTLKTVLELVRKAFACMVRDGFKDATNSVDSMSTSAKLEHVKGYVRSAMVEAFREHCTITHDQDRLLVITMCLEGFTVSCTMYICDNGEPAYSLTYYVPESCNFEVESLDLPTAGNSLG